jgi:transcriptional regulator GlxA family with amidase domain
MTRHRPAARRVAIVAFPGVQAIDITGPHEVFAGATRVLASATVADGGYDVAIVSRAPGPLRTESGLTVVADDLGSVREIDTLVVPGGSGVHAATADHDLIDTLAVLASRSRRVVGVCSGAFVLAAMGQLDGRRATTHWARADQLARQHPTIDVDTDAIWVRDGNVWTSAGVTAGIDVALALVEDDVGVEVAETVARWLVMFLRRPGGQSQFAGPVWRPRARLEPVRRAQDLIDTEPSGDHRVGVLAARVAMSERHFLRRFTAETGCTPARYVAQARVEAARHELETTDDTVAAIATRVGFGTSESMRRTFIQHLKTPPDDYRRRFSRRLENRSHPA